jgi:hypothetical protein
VHSHFFSEGHNFTLFLSTPWCFNNFYIFRVSRSFITSATSANFHFFDIRNFPTLAISQNSQILRNTFFGVCQLLTFLCFPDIHFLAIHPELPPNLRVDSPRSGGSEQGLLGHFLGAEQGHLIAPKHPQKYPGSDPGSA